MWGCVGGGVSESFNKFDRWTQFQKGDPIGPCVQCDADRPPSPRPDRPAPRDDTHTHPVQDDCVADEEGQVLPGEEPAKELGHLLVQLQPQDPLPRPLHHGWSGGEGCRVRPLCGCLWGWTRMLRRCGEGRGRSGAFEMCGWIPPRRAGCLVPGPVRVCGCMDRVGEAWRMCQSEGGTGDGGAWNERMNERVRRAVSGEADERRDFTEISE